VTLAGLVAADYNDARDFGALGHSLHFPETAQHGYDVTRGPVSGLDGLGQLPGCSLSN